MGQVLRISVAMLEYKPFPKVIKGFILNEAHSMNWAVINVLGIFDALYYVVQLPGESEETLFAKESVGLGERI